MAESRNAAGESEVLLAGKTLDKIPYSDKPLTHPGAKITYLTHDGFLKKFSCRYSESIHGNKKIMQECHARLFENWGCIISQIGAAEIKERLEQPLDCLVVCKTGDRYVLMTSKSIPAETLVAVYAGEIKLASEVDKYQDRYQYDLTTPAMQECIYTTTPHKIGGLGRFMQHLPEKTPSPGNEDELADVVFTKPTTVAYENIDTVLIDYNGVPLTVMYTSRDIEANEQLGYSFGKKFWQARNEKPRYFTPNAELIPASDYYYRGVKKLYLLNSVKNDPELVYKEGLELYKRASYELALAAFRLSTELFAKKNPEGSVDAAKGLSGMASCYRELNNLQDALKACEIAMPIYAKYESKDLDKLYVKYQECLVKHHHPEKYSIEEISASADAHFHSKDYKEALRIFTCLSYRYKQETGDHRLDIALCHSAVHSCYVALNEISLAIYHCRKSLEIRKSVPDLCLQSKIIEVNELRLAELEALPLARKRAANPRP